ncbi:MAG: hypothetical protein IKN04_11160 [Clostridia bacterium]|nr:hypothetical protein [Clostridia bacterium]
MDKYSEIFQELKDLKTPIDERLLNGLAWMISEEVNGKDDQDKATSSLVASGVLFAISQMSEEDEYKEGVGRVCQYLREKYGHDTGFLLYGYC